jgi:lipopolysaccharide transport system ATP-binding protein
MNDCVISAEGLSKFFLIGPHQSGTGTGSYSARREFLRLLPMMAGRAIDDRVDNFWALRDVNFEIRAGDVVGLIGSNGSGKSTILKILSRITLPSRGRFEIRGRVASLLEVGTGFHPDLTGRQNIYLNGSILGMTQREIANRFDEIVNFAEVEKFIDTPVRHYSSGMYMRLAFSVAAHLDTDILLVDEVLSVGDLRFQKKSLTRMKGSLASGKTVIFVSHSMSSVLQVCNRCLWLDEGRLVMDGATADVVERYVGEDAPVSSERTWTPEKAPLFTDQSVRLRAVRVLNENGRPQARFDVKEGFDIEVEFDVLAPKTGLYTALTFNHDLCGKLFTTYDNLDSPWTTSVPEKGGYRCSCHVPADFLNEGTITIDVGMCDFNTVHWTGVESVLVLHITDDMKPAGVRGTYNRPWPPSGIRPRLHWRFESPREIRV